MSRPLSPPRRVYAADEQFTAADFNRFADYSADVQDWWRQEHHEDGWHNAMHIPFAAALVEVSSGLFVDVWTEGVSVVGGGTADGGATGLCTLGLTGITAKAVNRYHAVAFPQIVGEEILIVEDADHTKTPSEFRLAIFDETLAPVDQPFLVLVFGDREP